jgi:hypothetical protein
MMQMIVEKNFSKALDELKSLTLEQRIDTLAKYMPESEFIKIINDYESFKKSKILLTDLLKQRIKIAEEYLDFLQQITADGKVTRKEYKKFEKLKLKKDAIIKSLDINIERTEEEMNRSFDNFVDQLVKEYAKIRAVILSFDEIMKDDTNQKNNTNYTEPEHIFAQMTTRGRM